MKELRDSFIVLELVLIGFQVLIWVSLMVLTVFGFAWLHLDALKQWSTEISVSLVGVAYMFGLIFDKAISTLPYSWIVGGRPTPSEDSPSPLAMRVDILTARPEVYEALEQRTNQHRLVRATVFNLAFISISALTFLTVRLGFSLRLFIAFLGLSIVFVGFALFTGKRSAESLNFELRHAHRALAATPRRDLSSQEEDLLSPSKQRRPSRAA